VIEADGHEHHSLGKTFHDDRHRGNALATAGLVVLHWTWKALHERPDELVAQARNILER
jgi:very-short-patch-repair endonuclease